MYNVRPEIFYKGFKNPNKFINNQYQRALVLFYLNAVRILCRVDIPYMFLRCSLSSFSLRIISSSCVISLIIPIFHNM